MLSPGTVAPDFVMPDQNGHDVHLADLRGKWVLLWWYPKAMTPGCTVEGQGLRDSSERFDELGVVILGASFDTPAENLAFAESQAFPFRVLSDVDHRVGNLYEVTRDDGQQYTEFARRFSYLIDPEGVVRRSYDVADVVHHAEHVIADVEAIERNAAR